jgi:hypothetical protein
LLLLDESSEVCICLLFGAEWENLYRIKQNNRSWSPQKKTTTTSARGVLARLYRERQGSKSRKESILQERETAAFENHESVEDLSSSVRSGGGSGVISIAMGGQQQ